MLAYRADSEVPAPPRPLPDAEFNAARANRPKFITDLFVFLSFYKFILSLRIVLLFSRPRLRRYCYGSDIYNVKIKTFAVSLSL